MLAEIDADPEVHAAFGSHAPAMPDDELGHGVPVCREHFDGGDIVGPIKRLYSLTSALGPRPAVVRPVREAPRQTRPRDVA